ncbi:tetratricopeptide repeat protein [Lacinutrix sp. C3R15]|uniref:tetratricopeptide repeat-containing sensor histidine kinase n=1 Tax=Flavobacteriaceae TaxID=49546 RepID=UPI001C07F2D3|nr:MULTISPECIES: tetratricopeptide repeat protein [Flavobacteriaceae]MBU2938309.1 tetratricopeptide repeat protein [Lacinutrix sp. C3R15]MDO6621623.1 tetratricopeptide repeat protein [Oceanihabitans sp. 1_MG-2023]
MQKLKNITALFFKLTTILLLAHNTYAQQTEVTNFDTQIQNVTYNKPNNYQALYTLFNPVSNDTIKMRYLATKSKETDYFEGESYALNMLGIFYRNSSKYNHALELHQQALDLAKKANNLELQVISLNMLGVVNRRLDLIRYALDFHKQALDLAETNKKASIHLQKSIAVSRNSMGNIYLVLKQYDLALSQFNQSLEIEKALDNKLGLAINYQNIGYVKESKGLLEEAIKNYNTSLNYNNQINSNIGRVICNNSIGVIYIKQEKFIAAQNALNTALQKALQLNDQYHIAPVYINLGWLQLKQKNYEASEINLKKGLKIANDYNLVSSKIDAYKHLSELFELKLDYKKANTYYKAHVALDQTVTNERNLQYVNDLVIKYESEKKSNQIKALANENEIVKLRLAQNRKVLLLSAIGVLLILGFIYILYRQSRLKSEKKIITLEQDMLRNQMNPHFIFNTLNSIKLYIINNEKENAVYYLNKFSKLIRKILVASKEKEISLADELETMTLYINIENIRFNNEIKYNVNIEKNVNTETIKVPSLILQPFLENALWHGLSSKTKNKEINIQVSKLKHNAISICITDNGIGRIASEKINRQKTLKRKSVGIAITKERLDNFSKQFTNDYTLDIIDLYDENNLAIGTKVIIEIPTQEMKLKTA